MLEHRVGGVSRADLAAQGRASARVVRFASSFWGAPDEFPRALDKALCDARPPVHLSCDALQHEGLADLRSRLLPPAVGAPARALVRTTRPETSEDPTLGEASSGTLGDLLGVDGTRRHSLEEDWAVLVRSIAAGDPLALHALYERAHRVTFTLILRITQSHEAAEELTVDVFHDVWRRASSYNPEGGPVLGWILNQARSRAIDRVRFEGRKKRVDPQTGTSPAEPETRADDILQRKQQERELRDALTILTENERIAIETAFFAELSYPEVADRLHQPLGPIKTRIRSALEKLRRALGSRQEGS